MFKQLLLSITLTVALQNQAWSATYDFSNDTTTADFGQSFSNPDSENTINISGGIIGDGSGTVNFSNDKWNLNVTGGNIGAELELIFGSGLTTVSINNAILEDISSINIGTNSQSSVVIGDNAAANLGINSKIIMNNPNQQISLHDGTYNYPIIKGSGKVFIKDDLTYMGSLGQEDSILSSLSVDANKTLTLADAFVYTKNLEGNGVIDLGSGNNVYMYKDLSINTVNGSASTVYFFGDGSNETAISNISSSNLEIAAIEIGDGNHDKIVNLNSANLTATYIHINPQGTFNLGNTRKTLNIINSGESGEFLVLDGATLDLKKGTHTISAIDNSVDNYFSFKIGSSDPAEPKSNTIALTVNGNQAGKLIINSAGSTTDGGTAMVTVEDGTKLKVTYLGGLRKGEHKFDIIDASGSVNTNYDINAISDANISAVDANGNNVKTSKLTFATSVGDNLDKLILTINKLSDPIAPIFNRPDLNSSYNSILAIGDNATGKLASFKSYIDDLVEQIDNAQNVNVSSASIKTASISSVGILAVSKTASELTVELESALDSITTQNDNSLNRNAFNNVVNSSDVISNRLSLARNDNLAVDDSDNSIRNKSMWMQAIGSIGEQKNHNDNYGYNLNSNGFMIGGDKQFFDNSRLGVAVAYINSDAKSKSENTKKTAIETYQLSLYGDYNLGKYFIDGTAGVGFNRYHSSRLISSQSLFASSAYNGETYFASANAGFKQELPFDLTLTPKAGLTYSRNNIAPYSESGAGNLGLTVNNIGSDFLEGKIGVDLGYKTTNYKDFNFDPKLSLDFGYDFIYDRQNNYSNFIGYSSNVVNSQADKVQKRSLKLGAKVNIYKVKELSFGATYNLEIRDRYQAHFGSLDAKYQF